MSAKILIAEDNPIEQKILSAALRAEGYAITECSDGKSALELLKAHQFELMVTDVMMPGCNGFELIAQAIKDNVLPPTIVLTSDQTDDSVLNSLDSGASDHLTKPVNIPILLAKIKKLIS